MRLIDADELKKALKSNCDTLCNDKNTNWCEHCCPLNDFEDLIDNAPTVEPTFGIFKSICCEDCDKTERPKGEWIEHYSKEMSEKGYFLCSRCKCGFQRFERGIRQSDLPWIDGQKYELHCIDNFCPNCGADMRGGNDGTEDADQ